MVDLTPADIRNMLGNKQMELSSTHNKLSVPIINRIYKKMKNGIKFDDIKVYEDLIIDGHHRYVSAILAEVELDKVKSSKTSATTKYDWEIVEFVDEEWDTEDKIRRLNQFDARFNNLSLEEIISITKNNS